jgi:hypothetical protein
MIRALQRIDKALCHAIDSRIEPIMLLEELETGSLKIWLRDLLTAADDQGLKDLDWQPLVGKYLVRAKYVYIKWANKKGPTDLLTLGRELRTIASETDVRHIPDYSPPSYKELAEATKDIDAAKAFLIPGDSIAFEGADGDAIEFDLAIQWSPDELRDITVKETVKVEDMSMVLIVKRPDYLGTAKWDLRHGRHPISAKIEDALWLRKFQRREVDVRPGDALRCRVTVENQYGYDNELIDEDYTVTKVESVEENHIRQLDIDGL